jgi:hypothetical protein
MQTAAECPALATKQHKHISVGGRRRPSVDEGHIGGAGLMQKNKMTGATFSII